MPQPPAEPTGVEAALRQAAPRAAIETAKDGARPARRRPVTERPAQDRDAMPIPMAGGRAIPGSPLTAMPRAAT